MLESYKSSLSHQLKPRTVAFFVRNDEVLLGFKKRGFGQGYYVGIGGKVDEGESIDQGIIREIQEEIEVTVKPENLKKSGVVNFYFPQIPDESWNMEVHAYLINSWKGEPQETSEIKPSWYKKDNMPYDQMWDDARLWIPQVLSGMAVNHEYMLGPTLKVVEFNNLNAQQ